ncbi:MAG TPA: hypothetical protein VL357_06030 [Rariglobus sp.]|jgi:hypothetical protein|nr:hypothetical protein [Rariglobus sp.]
MPTPYYTPDTFLLELYNALSPWAVSRKGVVSIAADPYNFLELLCDTPTGCRLVLHWEGETNPADDSRIGVFATNRFSVGVTGNLGLEASPEKSLIAGNAVRPAFLETVAAVREFLRAHVFAEAVSTKFPLYKGAEPVVLPEGMPLRAYRLNFEITLGLPPIDQA